MNSPAEEVKSRLNIVDLVGEYVKLQKAGANWKANCPFHHEKSPSFMVHEEKQIWHCFGCNKGGDLISFVMEIETMDFKEALSLLAERAGVEIAKFNTKTSDEKGRIIAILEEATKFFEKRLSSVEGEIAREYLNKRGINDQSIAEFRLGISTSGWTATLQHLQKKGFSDYDIALSGLAIDKGSGNSGRYYDRFRDRIMFPVQDALGKVIGFSARVMPGGDESQAKYINTPETAVYHKSNVLYGIQVAKHEIKTKDSILLVEGNMDVIAAHQAGLKNAVAVSGTALTEQQLDILGRYSTNINMLFDMDSAGIEATKRSALLCFEKGFGVSIVQLGEGKDAAELAQKDPQKLIEAVSHAKPAIEYFFQQAHKRMDVKTATGKRSFFQELSAIIASFENEIERNHWIKKLAEELSIKENEISGVIKKENLRRRSGGVAESAKEEDTHLQFRKRSDIIRDKIVGLMVSNQHVWKEVSEDSQYEDLHGDKTIGFFVREGRESEYIFDVLIQKLPEQHRKKLQRLQFESKYEIVGGQIEEYDKSEVEQLLDESIREFRKELQKERLNSIINDIKRAEESGDKETLRLLMEEFSTLSQKLS